MKGDNAIIRRHFSLVGQAKGSNDCGFFCGMVFYVAIEFTRHESR